MNPVFFGQYLLDQGIIDASQLAKALTAQETINKQIGAIAVNKELLTMDQVQEILEKQKTDDLFFGQIAQKLGYLNQKQVDMLVEMQKNDHICLGEVLVTLGYVTKVDRDKALADFILEQNKKSNDIGPFAHLKILEKERPFIEKFTTNTIKLLQRMSGVLVKFDKYEQIDQDIILPGFAAQVNLTDKNNKNILRYIFMIEREFANTLHLKLCRRYGIDAESIKQEESLGELLNIICCTSCSSCLAFTQINATVPNILTESSSCFGKEEKAILVSLISPFGPIRFVLCFS